MQREVTLSTLTEHLVEYEATMVCHDEKRVIVGAQLWAEDASEDDASIVFVLDAPIDNDTAFSLMRRPLNLIILNHCTGTTMDDSAANVIFLQTGKSAREIVRFITKFIAERQRLATCMCRLFDVLKDGGNLQDLVEAAINYSGNPFTLLDPGYKVAAANKEIEFESELGRRLLQDRYLGPLDFKTINTNGLHQLVMKSDEPVLLRNPHFPNDRIVADLKVRGKSIGNLILVSSMKPFTPFDYELISIVRDVAIQIMLKDELAEKSTGKIYEYFFTDLLSRKIVDNQQFQKRLKLAGVDFYDWIYLTLVSPGNQEDIFESTYVMNRLKQALSNSYPLFYEGNTLFVTIRSHATALGEQDFARLNAVCEDLNLVCGMSNAFRRPQKMSLYYKQAQITVELAKKEKSSPGMFRFEMFATDYLFSSLEPDDVESFCHPAAYTLLEYDQSQNAEMVTTLHAYLVHERNIAATAEFLHTHRNTVAYRLRKIEGLVRLNLDDYVTRLYLSASLHVIKSKYGIR